MKTNNENTILNSFGNTENNALNLVNAEESKNEQLQTQNEQLQMPQGFPSNNFTNELVFPDDELDAFDSEPKPEQEKKWICSYTKYWTNSCK